MEGTASDVTQMTGKAMLLHPGKEGTTQSMIGRATLPGRSEPAKEERASQLGKKAGMTRSFVDEKTDQARNERASQPGKQVATQPSWVVAVDAHVARAGMEAHVSVSGRRCLWPMEGRRLAFALNHFLIA